MTVLTTVAETRDRSVEFVESFVRAMADCNKNEVPALLAWWLTYHGCDDGANLVKDLYLATYHGNEEYTDWTPDSAPNGYEVWKRLGGF